MNEIRYFKEEKNHCFELPNKAIVECTSLKRLISIAGSHCIENTPKRVFIKAYLDSKTSTKENYRNDVRVGYIFKDGKINKMVSELKDCLFVALKVKDWFLEKNFNLLKLSEGYGEVGYVLVKETQKAICLRALCIGRGGIYRMRTYKLWIPKSVIVAQFKNYTGEIANLV